MYTEDGITAQYDQGVLTFSGSGTLTKTIVDNTIRTLSIAEKSITTINIGGGISAIGERAFYRRGQSSDADTTINIGSTVKSIGDYAFYGNHDMNYLIKDATCTEDGNTEHWKCNVCGKLFCDENGTTEITEASTVIPAHHTLVHHAAVAETCTENGNTEYWKCDVCGDLFGDDDGETVLTEDNITIAATGHAYAWHTYKNDDGTFHDCKICSKCDDLLDEGHFKYALDEDKSGKEWTTGSDQDLFVKIINIADNPGYSKGDDPMITRLSAVYVDGNVLGDTDYSATAGSIDIHILPAYLKNLSVGEHTVDVKVSYAFVILLPDGSEIGDSDTLSLNHKFTVVKPASAPSSPKTGESEIPMVICMALMLLAAYGAVYSFTRRKNREALTSNAE